MAQLKREFDAFIMSIPKGAVFSIIGAISLYSGAKGWIGDQEMMLIAAVLSSLGFGANEYVKSLYKKENGDK